jgi:hypothetical protein
MEMITGMAMRKQRIGGRHHLDVRARGNTPVDGSGSLQ